MKRIGIALFIILGAFIIYTQFGNWFSPPKITAYADQLFASHILDAATLQELKKDANAGKLKHPYDLIRYCSKTRYIDLAHYSDNPAIYLEQIHREVSGILPELQFTDFTYRIEPDTTKPYSGTKFYHVVIGLHAHGKDYLQSSFIDTTTNGQKNANLGKIDAQTFYQIFNKILADQHSALRLHFLQPGFQYEGPDFQHFGIIALTKDQTDVLLRPNGFLTGSFENFSNSFTSNRIDSLLQAYDSLGLFRHLSAAAIESATTKVKQESHETPNTVLACFPNTMLNFDTELGNLENPYAELLRSLSLISHKAFNPTEISDDFNNARNKKVHVRFKLNDTVYEKDFNIQDDWVDPDFFDFIAAVIKERKLDGQFYYLYTGGQDASVVYLSYPQYSVLKSKKLLVFEDDPT